MSKVSIKCPTLSTAVRYCEMMGWGYDVAYPHLKYYTKKNYSDNFMWKGYAKEEELYD